MKDYIAIAKYSLASHQQEKRRWLTIGLAVGIGFLILAYFTDMPISPALALIFICGANIATSYFVKEDQLIIRLDKKSNLTVIKPSIKANTDNTILWQAGSRELKEVIIESPKPKSQFLTFKKSHDEYSIDLNKYSFESNDLTELQQLPQS
jgi:hypothetical protein